MDLWIFHKWWSGRILRSHHHGLGLIIGQQNDPATEGLVKMRGLH